MDHVTVGRSWSPELRVSLIRAIRPRKRLWRKGGAHDSDTRMTLWTEVQEAINKEYDVYIEIDELKKTWKNLKDNFLRVKKTVAALGSMKPAKKWFFFDELQFLDHADGPFKPFQNIAPDLETEELNVEPAKKRFKESDQCSISIPEIDWKINTKQQAPPDAIILDLEDDLDEIRKLTAGKWDTGYSKRNSIINSETNLPCSSTLLSPPIEQKPVIGFTTSSNEKQEDHALIGKIVLAIPRIRGDFQKAAIVYLRKNGKNNENVMQILDDFDNYIYHNKAYTDVMKKVVKSCLKTKQAEFEQLFYLVEKYRSQLFTESGDGNPFDKEVLESPAMPYPREHINLASKGLIGKSRKLAAMYGNFSGASKISTERKIREVQREIDRITAELGGQPSVIRRTKLKNSLIESQNKLMQLVLNRGGAEDNDQEDSGEIPYESSLDDDLRMNAV